MRLVRSIAAVVGVAGLVGGAVALASYGHAALPTSTPPLILISLDTFRADRMGVFGNADGLTPNLDAFAAESTVFTRAYSQACNTRLSHSSVFTSRYPSEQQSKGTGSTFGSDNPLFPKILGYYGYQTGAFVGGADLSPELGLDVAFDTYASPKSFGSLYHTVPLALQWLDQRQTSRPYFAFIHGYDTHTTYLKPQPYGFSRTRPAVGTLGHDAAITESNRIVDGRYLPFFPNWLLLYAEVLRPNTEQDRAAAAAVWDMGDGPRVSDADMAYVRGVYDGAVTYADTMFGLLMASLQQRGILDEAVIIVMSDHGEELGEHGIFWHDFGLEDEEDHVPLMIRMPGGAGGGKRVDGVVELVDLMPTFLELAGAKAPEGMQGRSLMPAVRGEAFEGRKAAFTESSKLIRRFSARGSNGRLTYSGLHPTMASLPDVVAAARLDGPGFAATEGADAAAAAALRDEMVAWLKRLNPVDPSDGRELSPELKASMRAHGYFDVAP